MESLYHKLKISLPAFDFELLQVDSIYVTFNKEPIALIDKVEFHKDNIKISYKTVFVEGRSIVESLDDLKIELNKLI